MSPSDLPPSLKFCNYTPATTKTTTCFLQMSQQTWVVSAVWYQAIAFTANTAKPLKTNSKRGFSLRKKAVAWTAFWSMASLRTIAPPTTTQKSAIIQAKMTTSFTSRSATSPELLTITLIQLKTVKEEQLKWTMRWTGEEGHQN